MQLRSFLRIIGSLKLAAVVLVLLCVAMGAATVYEAANGTPAAMSVFYKNDWFEWLLWLLGINIMASALARWPWQRRQLGFLATHASILLILSGALVTKIWGIDGQVGIIEGQTGRQFTVRDREVLALRKAGDTLAGGVDLAGGIGGYSPIDRPSTPLLKLGDVQVEVQAYLPDSQIVDRVVDDNPQPAMALRVQLAGADRDSTAWIFADEPPASEVPVTLRAATQPAEFGDFLAAPTSQPAGDKRVKVEVAETTVELPLEQCLAGPVAIGQTGYSIRVLRYLPDAKVGEGRQLVSASDRPVNPAIETEVTGPAGTAKRYAFSLFPDLGAMHAQQDAAAGVKVAFIAPSVARQTMGIEVLAGPDGRLAVRMTPEDGEPMVREVAVGTPVDTPWEGLQFQVLERYDRARRDHRVVPVAKPRDDRVPAVQVHVQSGSQNSTLWLRKLEPQQVSVSGATYELAYEDKTEPLGFSVRLDKFRIGRYPGSGQPRSFESHIALIDARGAEQSRVISMNHPVKFGSYSLFQSSYQQGRKGTMMSVLSVSWDPGQPIVFAGYVALVLSMLYVVARRTRRRADPANDTGCCESRTPPTGSGVSRSVKSPTILVAMLGMLAAGVSNARADAPTLPSALNLDIVRAIPVQHDGRWMPLDTLARDEVQAVTGTESYKGHDAVAVLLAWTFDPRAWANEPLVRVHPAELRTELSLPADKELFSYNELASHKPLLQLIDDQSHRTGGKKPNPLESKVSDIHRKLLEMQDIFGNEVIRAIPDATDAMGAWTTIVSPADTEDGEVATVRAVWADLRQAFAAHDAKAFADASNRLSAELAKLPTAHRPDPKVLATELAYNAVDPYRWAWQIMAVGALLAAIAVVVRRRWVDVIAVLVILAGFAQLSHGIWMRGQIADRLPAANMFESLLFLSWGAGAFAIVSMLLIRDRFVPLTASFIGALSLCLADVLPIDHFIRPIAPVLLDTAWMTIHVPGIMISYAVLALAMLIAHAQLFAMALAPQRRELIDKLDSLHYWYVHVGTILLGAGIITGSMWAASSWGRYWGWDPKEVWSLIAFLAYLVILHVRLDREATPTWIYGLGAILAVGLLAIVTPKLAPLSGLKLLALGGAVAAGVMFVTIRGQFATAVKSTVAFWFIIMTYVGVNYVLGIGLHSYGFGTGAVAWYMLLTGSADLLFVAVLTAVYLLRSGRTCAQKAAIPDV